MLVDRIAGCPREERCAQAFSWELSLIKNPKIVEFVKYVFDKLCPEYFWTVGASSSGKYHPQFAQGQCGLVRHTKMAVWWAVQLHRVTEGKLCGYDLDEAIAAILLHDILKQGNPQWTLANSVQSHGIFLAQKIMEADLCPQKDGAEPEDWACRIVEAVQDHMGRWTDHPGRTDEEFLDRMSVLSAFVHLCDYVASRKVEEGVASLYA